MTPDATPHEAHAGDEDGADVDAQTLPIGYLIGGKYEIKRLLGVGGNGAVYEGEHAAVGHRVAIKVVHASLTGREDVMSRFRHEARVCGSLRHQNVGQVYDIGELEDGSPYMVMELQEGHSLADIIDDARLPIPAIVNLTQQLLSALGAAHHAGVVHRDVKPDNVMIVRDHGGDAIVKLVDFGISKALTQKGERTHDTEEGLIIGSPDYMSPEQLRGEDVDLRTDIYSTGVLLYELITQRLPFEHEQLAELMVAILRDPVTSVRKLRPDCPAELERVVLKAMSRKRERRYGSAAEMSRDLATARHSAEAAAASLAGLSERPADGSAAAKRRRRTIDARTLQYHRDRTLRVEAPRRRRPQLKLQAGIGLIAATALLLAWLAAQPEPRVVVTEVTPLADTPPAPSAAPPQPAAMPAPAAVPQAVQEPPAEEAPAPTEQAAPEAAAITEEQSVRAAPEAARQRRAAKAERRAKVRDSAQAPAPPAESVPELERAATTAVVQGQTARARALYRQILEQAPASANAWRGLAVTASRMGARGEAERALRRYLTLRPNAPDAERVRAQVESAR